MIHCSHIKEYDPWHSTICKSALIHCMTRFGDAGTGDAGAKLEALKAGKGFYIGFFHVNFTLLSQNQRPNSPPIQSLIGLEGLTVRVVS